jgi:hypothetical protein
MKELRRSAGLALPYVSVFNSVLLAMEFAFRKENRLKSSADDS